MPSRTVRVLNHMDYFMFWSLGVGSRIHDVSLQVTLQAPGTSTDFFCREPSFSELICSFTISTWEIQAVIKHCWPAELSKTEQSQFMHKHADWYVVQAGWFPCYKAALNENSVQHEATCAALGGKKYFPLALWYMQFWKFAERHFFPSYIKMPPRPPNSSATCKLQVSILYQLFKQNTNKNKKSTPICFAQQCLQLPQLNQNFCCSSVWTILNVFLTYSLRT